MSLFQKRLHPGQRVKIRKSKDHRLIEYTKGRCDEHLPFLFENFLDQYT